MRDSPPDQAVEHNRHKAFMHRAQSIIGVRPEQRDDGYWWRNGNLALYYNFPADGGQYEPPDMYYIYPGSPLGRESWHGFIAHPRIGTPILKYLSFLRLGLKNISQKNPCPLTFREITLATAILAFDENTPITV